MRVGLTGATGLLGSTLKKQLNGEFEVIDISRGEYEVSRSHAELLRHFESLSIGLLIHCAANTDVEGCETEPDKCYSDNLLRTDILAYICSSLDIKMVLISSTGVYGQHKAGPYCEYDNVNPTTHHHNSKLLAEQSVLKMAPNNLVIRTGWLFGGTKDIKKNFVVNRLKEARSSSGVIKSDKTQIGNPTCVVDVAKQLCMLVDGDYQGVFNCVGEGSASRFEYVQQIMEFARLDVSIEPVESSAFNRKAKVSNNESALNFKLNEMGINTMRSWKEALRDYVESLKGDF